VAVGGGAAGAGDKLEQAQRGRGEGFAVDGGCEAQGLSVAQWCVRAGGEGQRGGAIRYFQVSRYQEDGVDQVVAARAGAGKFVAYIQEYNQRVYISEVLHDHRHG
jgi:hypothetical protein